MENEYEEVILTDDTQEEIVDHDETFEEDDVDEEKESLRKELATLKAQKEHWKKKAQTVQEVKQDNTSTKEIPANSVRDYIALSKAGIEEDEDIDEVMAYAKIKGISVREALKSSVVKAIIADKSEFRKTAEVSNTSNARRGNSKVSDEALLANLGKGNIPEKGSEEAERIFWARRGGKR